MIEPEWLTCGWCNGRFERLSNRGPTPTYCCTAHRVAAFRRRRFDKATDAQAVTQ